MAERQKQINIGQVVNYLNHAFNNAMQKAIPKVGAKNGVGSKLHEYQVDFCYLVDQIERGPRYIAPKKISEANELIARLAEEE